MNWNKGEDGVYTALCAFSGFTLANIALILGGMGELMHTVGGHYPILYTFMGLIVAGASLAIVWSGVKSARGELDGA